MDIWGESDNCPECGQAISMVDIRRCELCGDEICYHCLENHTCLKCAGCGLEMNRVECIETDDLEKVHDKDCYIMYLLKIIEQRDESIARLIREKE